MPQVSLPNTCSLLLKGVADGGPPGRPDAGQRPRVTAQTVSLVAPILRCLKETPEHDSTQLSTNFGTNENNIFSDRNFPIFFFENLSASFMC